jgi:hypothetical protein
MSLEDASIGGTFILLDMGALMIVDTIYPEMDIVTEKKNIVSGE